MCELPPTSSTTQKSRGVVPKKTGVSAQKAKANEEKSTKAIKPRKDDVLLIDDLSEFHCNVRSMKQVEKFLLTMRLTELVARTASCSCYDVCGSSFCRQPYISKIYCFEHILSKKNKKMCIDTYGTQRVTEKGC